MSAEWDGRCPTCAQAVHGPHVACTRPTCACRPVPPPAPSDRTLAPSEAGAVVTAARESVPRLLAVVDATMRTHAAAEAADERARIVWWLRAGISGPGMVNSTAEYLAAATELADAIEQHPERFAEAPTTGRP